MKTATVVSKTSASTPHKLTGRHFWEYLLLLGLTLAGGWQSLHTAFLTWYADPDIASIVLAARGMQAYGWAFLKDFRFPLDNWLLSLIVPDSLIFRIWGDDPTVLLKTGVGIFWITALLTGLIVGKAAGLRRGWWASVFILWASQPALGTAGYMTYAVAHNVSMLWGLGSVFFIAWALKKSYWPLLFPAGLMLVLATYSDPWMLAAFILPLGLSASAFLLLSASSSKLKWVWLSLIGAAGLSILAAKTSFFGLLPLLSFNNANFVRVHISFESVKRLAQYITYFFNTVPFPFSTPAYDHDYRAAPSSAYPPTALVALNCVVFISALVFVSYAVWRKWNELSLLTRFLLLFAFFSLGITMSAGVVTGRLETFRNARYIVNSLYMVVIALLIIPRAVYRAPLRKIMIALGGFYFCASFLSNAQAWTASELKAKNLHQEIVSFLEQHDITLALGQYWLAGGNAVTWQTHEKIRVLPMNYQDRYLGFLPDMWTSPQWYKFSTPRRWAFILTGEERECWPFFTCEKAVENQFGQPDSIERKGNLIFMIYGPSTPEIEPIRNHRDWKAPHAIDLSRFEAPTLLDVMGTPNGWDGPRPHHSGHITSTTQPVADIKFPVRADSKRVVSLKILLTPNGTDDCDVTVKLPDGQVLTHWIIRDEWAFYHVDVPVAAGATSVTLRFIINDLQNKPSKVGLTMSRGELLDP